MAEESDLIMKLTMAVVGDPAGAKRSAQEIAEAIDGVIDAEIAALEGKVRAGLGPEDIQAAIAGLQEAVRQWRQTIPQQTALGQTAALGPGVTRARTAAGTPLTDSALKGRVTQNMGLVQGMDIMSSLRDKMAAASQRMSVLGAGNFSIAEAAQDMTEAMRQRANILNLLAKQEGKNAGEYARQIARVRSAEARIEAQVQERLAADAAYINAQVRSTVAQSQITAQTQAQLARSNDYIRALASSTQSQQIIQNRVAARLAADDKYIKSVAGGRILQERQNASVLARLASNDRYATELARSALAQQQINNRVLNLQNANDTYAKALFEGKLSQQQINNRVALMQANSNEYVQAIAEGKLQQQRLNTRVLQMQAGSSAYTSELFEAKLAQQNINNSVLRLQVASDQYVQALAQGRMTQAELNNRVLRSQIDSGFASTQAQTKALQAELNAATQAQLAQMPGYVQSLADAKISQATVNARTQMLLVNQGLYATALAQAKTAQSQINNNVLRSQLNNGLAAVQAEAKVLQAELNVQTQRHLVQNTQYLDNLAEAKLLQQRVNNEVLSRQLINGYVDAQAEGKVLQEQLNARLRQQLAGDPRFAGAQADRQIADRTIRGQTDRQIADELNTPVGEAAYRRDQRASAERKAIEARLNATDQVYIQHQAEAAAAKKFENAQSRQKQIADANYINAVNLEAVNSLEAARIKKQAALAAATSTVGAANIAATEEAAGVLAARERVSLEFRRVTELRELLGLTQTQSNITALEVQEALEGRNLQDTLNKLRTQRIALTEQAIAADLMDGRSRQQKAATQPGATGGLGLASSFRTTLRYGIAGSLIYGAASGISEAIREATELDRLLNQLQRQFQSQIGGGSWTAEAQEQFREFRAEIFETARMTGIAADKVADVGFQLQGAFGGNTQRAILETQDAIIAAQVTGLDVTEVIDSFTALTQSFDEQNLSIINVSDAALRLQENLGVLAKETITFAADLAPVGAELGFTANQLAAIGAVAQQTSGRSGASLAEAFGRVLPAIQGNAAAIVEIFDSMGGDASAKVVEAFRNNDISAVFDELLLNYNRLGAQGQGQLIEVLGGRREAQSIIGVLKNGSQVITQYGAANESAGATSEYFADLQKTLQVRTAQLGEEFKRFVQILFESGLKDFFTDLLDILSTALRLIESLASAMSGMGSALGPLDNIVGTALTGALIFRGARGVGRGYSTLRNRGRDADNPRPTLRSRVGGGVTNFRANVAAGQAAGNSYGRSFAGAMRTGAMGALPSILGIGATIGATYLMNLDSSVRSGAEDAARRLHDDGGITDWEIGTALSGLTEGLVPEGSKADRAEIRRLMLEEGYSVASLIDEFSGRVRDSHNAWERGIDSLPGEFSSQIADDQARAAEIVRTVGASLFQGFDRGLAIMETSPSFTRDVEQAARTAFNLRDTKEGIADELRRSLREFQVGGITNLQGIQSEAEAAGAGPRVQEAISRLAAQHGPTAQLADISDRDLIDAIMGPDWLSQVSEVQKGYREALESGNMMEFLRDLQSDIASGNTEVPPELQKNLNVLFQLIAVKGRAASEINREADAGYQSLEEAIAGYDAGLVTAERVDTLKRRQIEVLRRLKTPDSLIEAMKLETEIREVAMERVTGQLDAMQSLGELQGGSTTPAMLSTIASQIGSDNFSIDQDAQLAQRAVEIARERQRVIAQSITDETERARVLAQDIQVDPVVAEALLSGMISANVDFADALSRMMKGDQQQVDIAVRQIAAIVVSTGKTVGEAILIATEIRRQAAIKARKLIEEANRAGNGLMYASVSAIDHATDQVADVESTTGEFQAQMDELTRIADEQLGALAGFDTSIEGADPEAMKALADDMAQKMEEAFQAYRETSEALLDLNLARVEGDPVKEAMIAQQQADLAARFARTEAERLSAMAERIRADRQLQQAMFEISNSQVDLLIAMAEAAGNSVEVADLNIRRVEDQIAQAKALGLGEAEMTNLQSELVSAKAARRDAVLSDRREYFQYLSDIGKISQGQLIGYLETLRAIPDLTEKQRRDLEVEIYNLRKQLGQDFQFNLPANLQLPTAYEVRRFDQSTGAAGVGGYNDNRNISVQVSVATGADPNEIANAVATVVGEPNRIGTAGRRF